MPPREVSAYLVDLIAACEAIASFLSDADEARYASELMLRSAVERQLMIVGEAVVHLRRMDEGRVEQLGPVRSIVAFRNILVHGYFSLDHGVVWRIASGDVPAISRAARAWMAEIDPPHGL
ncbi:MAG: DUF86 domain-containing protein [Phycisphaeraceae bacterium]|nr:DUF86 domain-containing protein [Phycisphaeraceae bacterium]